jgi:hypothetical protein
MTFYFLHQSVRLAKDENLFCYSNSFVIAGNGMVFEALGWNQKAMLPKKYMYLENIALHIGFVGTYGGTCVTKTMVMFFYIFYTKNQLLGNFSLQMCIFK